MKPGVNLRFLLPVLAGQRLVLLDDGCWLGEATEAGDWRPIEADPATNVLEDLTADYADHLILPELDEAGLGRLQDAHPVIRRILKSGGWLLVGMQHAGSLARLGRRQHGEARSGVGFHYPFVRRILERGGFGEQRWYGVFGDLRQPRHVVPLERAALSRHFFEALYVPYSPQAAWLSRLAGPLAFRGLQRLLYPGLLVAARRSAGLEARSHD